MAPNHDGDPLGTILGPMGSHWGHKMGQNRHKLPCPKIRIFDYSAVIDWEKKIEFTVMAPNHGGEPLGYILGPMGSHWGQKNASKTVKNYHVPKFELLTTPRSSIWAKNRIYSYGALSRSGSPRVHLGANGVPLGPKNGSKRTKLPCPKIRIFDYSVVIDLGKKSNWRLRRQITVGSP